jgi:hypothetical protein
MRRVCGLLLLPSVRMPPQLSKNGPQHVAQFGPRRVPRSAQNAFPCLESTPAVRVSQSAKEIAKNLVTTPVIVRTIQRASGANCGIKTRLPAAIGMRCNHKCRSFVATEPWKRFLSSIGSQGSKHGEALHVAVQRVYKVGPWFFRSGAVNWSIVTASHVTSRCRSCNT